MTTSLPMPFEFEIDKLKYRASPINARLQFHIARRLAPLMVGVFAFREIGMQALPLTLDQLAKMPDADLDYVLDAGLASVSRLDGANLEPQPIFGRGGLRYADITMGQQMRILMKVVEPFLSDFFESLPNVVPQAGSFTSTTDQTTASSLHT